MYFICIVIKNYIHFRRCGNCTKSMVPSDLDPIGVFLVASELIRQLTNCNGHKYLESRQTWFMLAALQLLV